MAVLDILKNVPELDNLLDIGCAEGTKTIQYAKMLSILLENVYGIETKPEYVKLAQEHFKIINANLEHETFPFQDQEIEIIICNQLLEHLKNIYFPLWSKISIFLFLESYILLSIESLLPSFT